MTPEDFNKLLDERLVKIQQVLASKAEEYATSDRLHNFKTAANISDTTPAKALWGMSMKHLVSVIDLINEDLDNNKHNVDEKIGDLINYLILLEAVFEDEREENSPVKRPEETIIEDFSKLLKRDPTKIDLETNF